MKDLDAFVLFLFAMFSVLLLPVVAKCIVMLVTALEPWWSSIVLPSWLPLALVILGWVGCIIYFAKRDRDEKVPEK